MFRRLGDPFSDLFERSRRHFRARFDWRVTDLCASSRPRDGRRETGCRREKAKKKEGWKAEEKNPGGEKGTPTANCNASAASRRAGICGRDTSSASSANAWPSSSMAMAHRNQVIVGRQSRTELVAAGRPPSWHVDAVRGPSTPSVGGQPCPVQQ